MKEFETSKLIIRSFKEDDAKEILENWTYDGKEKRKYNPKACEDLEMIKVQLKSAIKLSDEGYPTWAIQEKDSKKLIGFVSANEVSVEEALCGFVFHIESLCKNKEHLKEALETISDYLLFEDDFDILTTKLSDSKNEETSKTVEVLEESGMKQEGRLRNRILNRKTNKIEDLLIFSLMRKDREFLQAL